MSLTDAQNRLPRDAQLLGEGRYAEAAGEARHDIELGIDGKFSRSASHSAFSGFGSFGFGQRFPTHPLECLLIGLGSTLRAAA